MQSNPVDDGLEKQSELEAFYTLTCVGPNQLFSMLDCKKVGVENAFTVNWAFQTSGASVHSWFLTVSAGARCCL